MPHKARHGGKRPGAGRKTETGSSAARPVHYRVTEAQRAELDAEGAREGISGDLVAKRRAFPPTETA